MMMYGTSSAACTAKMTVPMWPHSQRSRKIWTGVMCPYRRPSAQSRVPMKKSDSGMTSADDEAIRPNVTTPLVNACPDEPRIAKRSCSCRRARGGRRRARASGWRGKSPPPRVGRLRTSEGEDPDVEDDREVHEHQDRGDQCRRSGESSRWPGQATLAERAHQQRRTRRNTPRDTRARSAESGPNGRAARQNHRSWCST